MASDHQMQPTVTAAVVTRNRREHLRRCLTDLASQTTPLRRTIVVDNESTDGTAELVSTEFKQVQYHRLLENTGSGGGYAIALRLAHESGAEWLWAIDDEAVIERDVLERLLKLTGGAQRVADIVLPAELDPQSGRISALPAWYGPLIHREVIAKIGLPRSDFFWYAADSEFFLRARRNNLRVVKTHDIVIVHDKRNPTILEKKRHPSRLYYQTRNTIYIRWHIQHRRLNYRFFRTFARVVLGRMLWVLVRREPSKFRKCQMIMKGAVDGLRGRLGKTVEVG